MVQLESITKSYAKGRVKAVDGLCLHVEPGEIFGFIGPNGAGKTTTIKIMTGALTPDAGRVMIGGVDMAADPLAAKKMFGYVPDNHEMFDRLTGAEYLNFLADVYGVPRDERSARAEEYLGRFGISDVSGQMIRSYSHGMKQKLLLTGSLLHDPPLWILDEPMVGLDPRAALALKDEMRARAKRSRTVFFSTHVLEVAERLCDRIGIVDGGKLIAVGTMDALRARAKDATLEQLFFSLTENRAGGDGDA